MKRIKNRMWMIMVILMVFCASAMVCSAEETHIAGGVIEETFGQISWEIDEAGNLLITGTGDVSRQEGEERVPWYSYRDQIISAEIRTAGMTDASYLLAGCENLTTVDLSHWDTAGLEDVQSMFEGCSKLENVDLTGLDFSAVKNMSKMFKNCLNVKIIDFAGVSTENVTNMQEMFYFCINLTHLNMGSFDTSNVINMSNMFGNCNSLKQLDLSGFDTGAVTDMTGMFYCCNKLETLDISSFDTANVTTMKNMFVSCVKLQSVNFNSWDTGNMKDMSGMFRGCKGLKNLDLSSFDTENVEDMSGMFMECKNLESVNVSSFDITNLTTMQEMFKDCISLKALDLNSFKENKVEFMTEAFHGCESLETLELDYFDASSLKDISYAFRKCKSLKQLDLSSFKTENLQSMHRMLEECEQLETVDFSNFDTSGVTSLANVFAQCKVLKTVDLSNFDTGNVTGFASLFENCRALESVDVSGFDTSKALYFNDMFAGCVSLKSLDVSNFDTSNAVNFRGMFQWCIKLRSLDLSSFDTGNVISMASMFYQCESLTKLDISNFDTTNVTSMGSMFMRCKALKHLDLSHFKTEKLTDIGWMFRECESLRTLDLSGWDTRYISNSYSNEVLLGCDSLMEVKEPNSNEWFSVELPKDENGASWKLPGGTSVGDVGHLGRTLTRSFRVEKIFEDVYWNQWYNSYVQYVFDEDLMSGSKGKFMPDETMTRGMVVQTLYNMENQPMVKDYRACSELKDVYWDWYTDAVCWAYNEGITTGYDDTKTFKVDAPVTREQLATFLYRYAKYKGYDGNQRGNLSGMKNADKVSSYAQEAVKWAVGAGLISGIDVMKDGKVVAKDLAPQGNASRAQMAAILQRFRTTYVPLAMFQWNGHTYGLFDNCNTWDEAEAYCESRGGYLAVITSEEENKALYEFVTGNGFESAYFGLSDASEEGTWSWVNGEEKTYENWHPDEPAGGAEENYAMFFYLYTNGRWNDGAFKENVYDGGNAYICEWNELF